MRAWCFSFAVWILLYSKITSAELGSIQQRSEPSRTSSQNVDSLGERRAVVAELARKVRDSQILKTRPYRFPMTWEQDKGMYPSHIKLNLAGEPSMAFVRDEASLFDNNMFATAWVTICLLETHLYAGAPRPTETQLTLVLEAIQGYQDKNRKFNSSVMNFWPQAYNESTGTWESTPSNLLRAFRLFDVFPAKTVEEILKLLGLRDLEHIVESVLSMRSTFERAFHIPPDFDDTFVNLGLGALLKDLSQELPEAFTLWGSHNTNITSVLDALRQYAYRPFSQDQNVNTIDTRTFYYMRRFLGKAAGRGEDLALVPTWVQNLDEARKNYYKGVAMPFQINNVDITVSANAIYGLTASVLSGIFPPSVLDDPDVKQVYVNTSSMVASQIHHRLFQRPDLELTYYPSVMEFYWFVARTFARLETALWKGPALPEAMHTVHSLLKSALESSMSNDVVSRAHSLSEDMVYFDDFLGDGDVDLHNKTVVRGEDRLFTTSMAVNALLTTWTLFDDADRTIRWKKSAPYDVVTTVEKSVRFLETYILRETYKPWNTFFSGSSKGRSSMPFGFPANRIEYLNGTVIHSDKQFPKGGPFLFGVQGYIPESQYQILLQEKHFGMDTPTTFTSYNQPGDYFPFWTSSAYTHATAMLALARFDSIVN